MKKLLLFISAACTTFSVFVQDYYPIKQNDIYFFGNLPLKVDSVKVEAQDSVYYLYKQIRRLDQNSNCAYTALGDSWLGDSVRVQPDGSCIFVNKF